MKKYLALLTALCLVSACSEQKQEENATEAQKAETPAMTDYADKEFTFDAASLQTGCEENSELVCTLNMAVKCSINPKLADCDAKKLPKFIFMEDESLERPTQVTYKINKLKPLAGGMVEVYTSSRCNASWFGLCEGNIIYVMSAADGGWAVKDVYARQSVD